MSETSTTPDTLLDSYKREINDKMKVSMTIKDIMNDAKTTLKKKYYSKKLIKNNKLVAQMALKLNRLIELNGEDTSS